MKELLARGFDAVIFGHTHHGGRVEMPDDTLYVNSGSWLTGTTYVVIQRGELTVKQWAHEDSEI